MGIYVQKNIHVSLDCLWYSTIREKMDIPHEHWISNEAYIITVMRFSCSYFCFGERRLVDHVESQMLIFIPHPKVWILVFLFAVKNVQWWTRIWKKMLIMSVKYETFMCELFGVFFFLKEDIHITHIFSILAFVNARMDKFLSNIPVQLNLSADIYSAGATKHSLGILVNTYTLWLCDTHKELYCKDFKIARPGRPVSRHQIRKFPTNSGFRCSQHLRWQILYNCL